MGNKKLNLLFIVFCVLLCMTLAGCKKETIKFHRESKVQELKNKLNSPVEKVQKSSGMIIYKDTSNSNNQGFGPNDINFDMPVRIK